MAKCTDTFDPSYYHKVVDCQYACPAHTPVPHYIRLIGEGRYNEAYLVNRASNVFPGVLGRVCDRPCEPACRRGRVDGQAVAICRLKRLAADRKDEAFIWQSLPPIPQVKCGKKIALIGAGPASLTVINDLLPLGYECTLFEKEKKAGGAMRGQVPGFRLPEKVLDDEIAMILERGGVDCHFGHEVTSLKALLPDYDAIFVGSGAPKGKDLAIAGRQDIRQGLYIGVEFLGMVAFGHLNSLPEKVLVIGGGNTAMDCARTAKRLGARQVTVLAPEGYDEMLASPWELEEALAEGVNFENQLLPISFSSHRGQLAAMTFQALEACYDKQGRWAPRFGSQAARTIPCEAAILAIGQTLAFPFIEDELGLDFHKDRQGKPLAQAVLDAKTHQSSLKKVFFGGDAAWGPKNIIWAVAHGHEAALSIHLFCQGLEVSQRPPVGMSLVSQKMGLNQWQYDNQYYALSRQKVPDEPVAKRIADLHLEVEKGFDVSLGLKEVSRCLSCDVQTVFHEALCLDCDACVDICPVSCLMITEDQEDEARLRRELKQPVLQAEQNFFIAPISQSKRLMLKDENLCLHCGLCAERCPTAAWDMQAFTLHLPRAKDA